MKSQAGCLRQGDARCRADTNDHEIGVEETSIVDFDLLNGLRAKYLPDPAVREADAMVDVGTPIDLGHLGTQHVFEWPRPCRQESDRPAHLAQRSGNL